LKRICQIFYVFRLQEFIICVHLLFWNSYQNLSIVLKYLTQQSNDLAKKAKEITIKFFF